MNLDRTIDPRFFRLPRVERMDQLSKYGERVQIMRQEWNYIPHTKGTNFFYLDNIPEVHSFYHAGLGHFEDIDGWCCFTVVFE